MAFLFSYFRTDSPIRGSSARFVSKDETPRQLPVDICFAGTAYRSEISDLYFKSSKKEYSVRISSKIHHFYFFYKESAIGSLYSFIHFTLFPNLSPFFLSRQCRLTDTAHSVYIFSPSFVYCSLFADNWPIIG